MATAEVREPRGTSSWKSRLTEEQLKRKRIADRENQRESRNNARQTIAKLKEQLQLVTSGHSQKLTAELLEANATLESQRDAYKSRIDAVFSALGATKVEDNLIEQQESQSSSRSDLHNHETREFSVETSEKGAQDNQIRDSVRDPIDTIMDARMGISQMSPFIEICSKIQDNVRPSGFSDDEFIQAVAEWKRSLQPNSSVFDLASRLYHINLAPTMLSNSTLQTRIRSPTFFQDVLRELSPTDLSNGYGETSCAGHPKPFCERQRSPVDGPGVKSREIIICALEATRFWHYNSHVERLAMFWAVYRITSVRV
jgi:hypothetical protein